MIPRWASAQAASMSRVAGGETMPQGGPSARTDHGRRPPERLRRSLALALLRLLSAWYLLPWRRYRYNILSLELSGPLAVSEDEGWRTLFRRAGIDFLTLVALLRWARHDPRLEIVELTIGRLAAGWALVEELRQSLLTLRGQGKTVWAYLLEPGLKEYYLGSAADKVILPPSSVLDVTGIAAEVTFVKDALEKLGIEAQITQVGRYKSLAEMFTRGGMSRHHREMVESLIGDLYHQIVCAIAESRASPPERIEALIGGGPYGAKEALEKGLIDAVAYEDELVDLARQEVGEPRPIKVAAYRRERGLRMRRHLLESDAATIALVDLVGPVKMGSSLPGAEGVRATGARSFARELEAIGRERQIQGVVVRVNSPGGSAVASDLMWRSVMKLREKKPVVVSLGDVAASGGYYVGMAGERVLCNGTTVTGSIGVLAGKAVLKGLYDQLGIRKEIVSRGGSPSRHSDYLALDEESAARLLAEAESFYEDFIAKVAECRRMDRVEVSKRAEGRVWSGRQAVENGLADENGGVERAIERLKEVMGVSPASLVAIERFPRGRKWFRLQPTLAPSPGLVLPLPAELGAWSWLAQAFASWWRGETVLALAATGMTLGGDRYWPWARPLPPLGLGRALGRVLAAVIGRCKAPPLPF